uniref:Uncharacterized protein n=1 Tax=Oryza barthii TaxID=65489 RepID=A0A0D3HSN3_9ORYZ
MEWGGARRGGGKSLSRLSDGQIRRLRPSSGHIVVTAASPTGSTVITVADPASPVDAAVGSSPELAAERQR